MGDKSGIEWTDATWNPVTGCTKVSPGCDHCYAERVTERFQGKGAFDKVVLHEDRIGLPLRWRKPRKVFVNSMSDLFHDDVPDGFIAKVFAVMATAYNHTFQVLTKRHGRMRSLLNSAEFVDLFDREYCAIPDWANSWPDGEYAPGHFHLAHGPLENVWLGVSVENQQWADIRIPALLDTPAAVRFLSCEPLLGPVDLARSINVNPFAAYHFQPGGIDWVIVGGESGPGARPMHPDWVRSLRAQCNASGVPFLFKQWGEWREDVYIDHDGVTHWAGPKPLPRDPRRMALHPAGMTALTPDNTFDPFEVGHPGWTVIRRTRHKSERDLDGRTWDEYPTAVTA